MEVTILSKCQADEAQAIANNTLFELEQKDFSGNAYLTGITTRLRQESANLSNSIGIERTNEFTTELADLDQIFDNRVICLKSFIDANTYASNPTIAQNANKVLKKFVAHDPYFYRLGYEKELARAFSIIKEFEKPEVKTMIDSLVGVAEPLAEVKTAAINLQTLYRKNQGILATKEQVVPSSVQKKVVIDIMNDDLIPYLTVMAKAEPDEYGETNLKVTQYIETINTKIRTRRTRNENNEEEGNTNEED